MAEKEATIYTDSRYAFGVAHDFGAPWKHRKFLKSDGRPILHVPLVAALLDAILLPDKLAICKCAAHTNNKDSVSVGNSRADGAAKVAASQDKDNSECSLLSVDDNNDVCSSLQDMQTFAMGLEKNKWRQSGCVMKDNVWKCAEGKVKAAQGKAAERPLHSLRPGDFVVIRDLRRKSWRAKRWLGPFQVLLTTETAVKVAERATWVHAGHCRKVPSPEKDSTRQ
ncbi:uncharacterized protein isoform X2 [Danio rerio]|uniref:Uncharacterized protein isoform X2 n=2 Tax=Danio rerio TaxID=7955 RepID=A0AB32T9V0_DANRE